MATTSQPTTFLEMATDLMQRVRVDTSATATLAQAKRYINIGLYRMHIGHGEKFPWAERTGVLVTHPTYATGTFAVTKGAAAVTGAGSTLWDTNNDFGQTNVRVGGRIQLGGRIEPYEVSAVASDTALTIDSIFLGDTVTAGSYTYYEDEYALASDFLRPISLTRFTDGPSPVDIIGRREFRERFPGQLVLGSPKVSTLLDRPFSGSTTPVRRVRFWPVPSSAQQIRYPYVTSNLAVTAAGAEQAELVGDTDEPIVPVRYRLAPILHGLYHWYRDKKNDNRTLVTAAEYETLLASIVGDTEIGSSNAKFYPRTGPYRRRAKRPYSGGGARFDLNGAFDRLEDRR